MAIPGLTIIGESINDSVPSTKKLFDANDMAGLEQLARTQDTGGAGYIDVNVGQRSAEFLADMVRRVQGVTSKPLSVDTPDPAMAEAGLKAYDATRAGGKIPVVNSISQLRLGMFDLLKIQKFMPILLVSERMSGGQAAMCHTAEETYQTARELRDEAVKRGLRVDQLIIDPGIAPIGSDSEGNIKRLMGTMRLIHADASFKGVHFSVGLSNFTVMLPPKRADGMSIKSTLESAFLTRSMPLGMDMVIGSVKRNYELLAEGHDALRCFDEVQQMEGFDAIIRVQEFYSA